MTNLEKHKHRDVIVAWADGHKLQCRYISLSSLPWRDWATDAVPNFNQHDLEWRVKPKDPKIVNNENLEELIESFLESCDNLIFSEYWETENSRSKYVLSEFLDYINAGN
jgi:hypothetical protein